MVDGVFGMQRTIDDSAPRSPRRVAHVTLAAIDKIFLCVFVNVDPERSYITVHLGESVSSKSQRIRQV
jgi:hypothetical protein